MRLSWFTPFTGRENELKQLNLLLEEMLDYNGGFVLIRGETGIGKTRLLSHFTDGLRNRSLYILTGRVIRGETKPFSPFTQMLQHLFFDVRGNRPWFLKFLPPQIAGYFNHLMPNLKNLYPVDLPEPVLPVDNLSITYSFQKLFDNLSKSRPLVIILNDIQLMSEESVQLLKHLVYRIEDQPILLLATVRSDMGNELLEKAIDELNRGRLIHNMNLQCFSAEDIENCLLKKFGGSLSIPFSNWLSGITKGNPLYVEEILKTLVRQNIIYRSSSQDTWLVSDDFQDFTIPETVESVIQYRLGNMTDYDLSVLQSVAVIGEKFSLKTALALMSGEPASKVAESCSNLADSGMLTESDGMMKFAHPLIHTILHRGIEKNKLRKLHRKLAGILREESGTEDSILPHMLIGLIPEEETSELSSRLFRTAESLLQSSCNYPRAHAYLKTALEIAERVPCPLVERLRIQSELNRLSWIMGNDVSTVEEAEGLADKLIRNSLYKEAATTCRMIFHTALLSGNMEEAEKFLRKGISLLETSDSLFWTLTVEHCLLQRRKGLLDESTVEAEKLSREIPEEIASEALYKVFKNMGLVSFLKGDVSRASEYMEKARNVVEEQHLLVYMGDSLLNLCLAEMTKGKIDSALRKLNDSKREIELLNQRPLLGVNLLYTGTCLLYLGEYRKAIKFFENTAALAEEINSPKLIYSSRISKAKALFFMGDIESAESVLGRIPEENIPRPVRCEIQMLRSQLYLKRTEFASAEKCVDDALSIAEELHRGTKYGIAAGIKSRILLGKKRRKEARRWLKTSRDNLFLKGEVPCMTEILVGYGLAAGDSMGEEALFEGLEMLFSMGALARIRDLKKILKNRDDLKAAADLITERIDRAQDNRIEVLTFGGLSARRPGDMNPVEKREWQSRKARELFALILIQKAPQGITREILAFHLWPDAIEKKAQANLRVALTHAGKALGVEAIIHDGPFLRVNRGVVSSDFLEFEELASQWRDLKDGGKEHSAEDRARRALDLYRGHFLPEFYTTPLLDKQDELEGIRRELLFWLATRSMEKCEWSAAAKSARILLIADSCNEKACSILMQSLVNRDDRIGALRQYDRLSACLEQEFDAEPGSALKKLHKQILGETGPIS